MRAALHPFIERAALDDRAICYDWSLQDPLQLIVLLQKRATG